MIIDIIFLAIGCLSFFIGRAAHVNRHALLASLKPAVKDDLDRAGGPVETTASAQEIWQNISRPAPKAVRGATPAHYRAFSLLESRVQTGDADKALFAFRKRVKTIKLEQDDLIHAEAIAIVETFATFAESYVPLHDRTHVPGTFATKEIEIDLLAAITRLDDALRILLSSGAAVNDERRIHELSRYIETRYLTEAENPFPTLPVPPQPTEMVGMRAMSGC